jgi:hypothetical protein
MIQKALIRPAPGNELLAKELVKYLRYQTPNSNVNLSGNLIIITIPDDIVSPLTEHERECRIDLACESFEAGWVAGRGHP